MPSANSDLFLSPAFVYSGEAMKGIPDIKELPPPPEGRTGWPWTEGSHPLPEGDWPSITIALPSFNQGIYLEQCIRSVILQAYPNVTFHLRDGGSTDESEAIIHQYIPWYDSWEFGPDGGQCAAINSVLLASDAELGGWMNTDDFYRPNALQHLAEAARAGPEHVVWAGNTEEIDIEDQHVRFYPPRIGEVADLAHWYLKFGFHQPSAIFRLDLFRELTGLDPDIYTCLDVELWLRMRARGSFGTTDEIISTVRNNPEAKAFKFARRQMVELLAVMHRNEQLDAGIWRLGVFADEIERDALRAIHDRDAEVKEEVLHQFTYRELIAHLKHRFGEKFKKEQA
jgi:glycosyltransferase involved in cell wall biosynthesis